MPFRKLAPFLLLALLASAVCAVPRDHFLLGTPPPGPALNCYLAALHLHGHSNHNGNPLPASMESHTAEAKRAGFDVMWWTDHAELYAPYRRLKIDFASATFDTSGQALVMGGRLGRQLSAIKVDATEGGRAELDRGRLMLRAESRAGASEPSTVRITPVSKIGKVHTINFCRPVSSGLNVDAWLDVQGLSRDTYIKFSFDFSWHPKGAHHAVLTSTETTPLAPQAVGDTTVIAQFEIPSSTTGGSSKVTFDLEKLAGLLPHGSDNTLSGFSMGVGAESGNAISVGIDSIVIWSEKPDGANQYATVDSLARAYSEAYGIREYVGFEFGRVHTPELPHMNAYYPSGIPVYQGLDLDTDVARRDWVAAVHRKGGLVSFNHPFGANRRVKGGIGSARSEDQAVGTADDYEDLPPAVAPRVMAMKGPAVSEEAFWEVAQPLLDSRGLDADMLEVGYLFRGTGSLDDHLRLWDLALANGIRLVGTGTSDSHGGAWGPDMIPNPFGTWIWARSPDAGDLLDGIRHGHVAFGDPFFWKSTILFRAENVDGQEAIMGDTLQVSAGHYAKGWLEIKPMRGDLHVRVVQVAIMPGREPAKSAATKSAAAATDGFPIAVNDSCYVRLEVYGSDGTPLAFTNPIYFFPSQQARAK
ncbi:MAG TPA: hypothetical protein VMU02_05960 [bacterium]|nr:hypothetical protein [bacterium]